MINAFAPVWSLLKAALNASFTLWGFQLNVMQLWLFSWFLFFVGIIIKLFGGGGRG